MSRLKLISVVGNGDLEADDPRAVLAESIGRALVDAGYGILTGGLGGVMDCASRGARSSPAHRPGMIVGVIPGMDPAAASEHIDIVLPTGFDVGRNTLMAHADAVVAVGGGAGTLSEMAIAWSKFRLIIGMRVKGWSGELAGRCIDDTVRYPEIEDDRVYGASNAEQVIELLADHLPRYQRRHPGIERS